MTENYRLKKYCFRPETIYRGNSVQLLLDAGNFFSKAFDIIEKARNSIVLEFYEFADDAIGLKLARLLKRKAAEGVRVRVIYDSIGSWFSSKEFFEDMEKFKIEVAEYNPARRFYNFNRFFRRDHRKILAADGERACLGGFNLSLDYAPASMGGREWKDSGVYLEGRAVARIFALFEENWSRFKGSSSGFSIQEKSVETDVPVSVSSASGLRNYLSIRRNYKYAIDGAVEEIFLTNAYFLPDRIIYRRLIKAARRGVDVKIITPGKTDHPYVRLASWAMFPKLIKNGVEIYEWKGKILHAKTAVIDGFWVSIGSHNLDHRSLHYNLELNVNIYDEKIGSSMREFFIKDLENCERITLEKCRQRSFTSKILSSFLYFFRSWL